MDSLVVEKKSSIQRTSLFQNCRHRRHSTRRRRRTRRKFRSSVAENPFPWKPERFDREEFSVRPDFRELLLPEWKNWKATAKNCRKIKGWVFPRTSIHTSSNLLEEPTSVTSPSSSSQLVSLLLPEFLHKGFLNCPASAYKISSSTALPFLTKKACSYAAKLVEYQSTCCFIRCFGCIERNLP